MGINIYVGNMPFNMTEDELREMFAPFGTVDRISVVTDRETGPPRGFAFVEMADQAQGEAAIKGLNGKDINGRPLTVNLARPREERGGGGAGGGGGFRRGGGGGGYDRR